MLLQIIVAISCAAPGAQPEGVAGESGPSVLLVVIDTLREDHLGCYGYDRDITPTIDSLSAAGTRWGRVRGQSAWTLPAFATIYTGLSERGHLAGFREGALYGVDDALVTLPEVMSEAGYATAGFYNVPVLDRGYGFSQGMDYVDYQGCELAVDAEVINEKFLFWVDSLYDPETPYFAVLHYFDPHYPYDPPEPWDRLWSPADHPATHWATESSRTILGACNDGLLGPDVMERLTDLYDGEIGYADEQLGLLLRGLSERGLLENTVVLVMADHGEEFMEHGSLLHGFTLHREITAVPMVACGPGVPSGEVDSTPASQMDVLPTIAALTGAEVPEDVVGVDLLSDSAGRRTLPASGFASDVATYVTVSRGSRRVFWDYEADSAWAYDLSEDPYEQHPVPADSGLVSEAAWYWATPPAAMPVPVPDTQSRVQALRDLGYFH